MSDSTHPYPELEQMRADMQTQDALYRPSAFWDNASARIAAVFVDEGIATFRRQKLPLGFFVPSYGVPGNCFTQSQVEEVRGALTDTTSKAALGLGLFLSGEHAALADYRVLQAADDVTKPPALHHFSESAVGEPVEQFEFDGKKFSRSSLNYLLGLAMLKKHLKGDEIQTVLEIGGGFGTLGEVLWSAKIPHLRYVDIDIPPTGFAAQYYLEGVAGAENVGTYAKTKELAEIPIENLPPLSVLCSWQIEKLHGSIDLFVNFISFQEMEPEIVQNYLLHVERLQTRWVLLRNIREGKQKRTNAHVAGVDTPILGDDYATMLPAYELVARSVVPFGFRTVDGFHSELFLFRRKG